MLIGQSGDVEYFNTKPLLKQQLTQRGVEASADPCCCLAEGRRKRGVCVSGMRPISVVAVSEMVRGNISLHHRHVEKGERGGNTKKGIQRGFLFFM